MLRNKSAAGVFWWWPHSSQCTSFGSGSEVRCRVLKRRSVWLTKCSFPSAPPRGRVGPQIHLTFSQAGTSLPVLAAALTSPPLSPGVFAESRDISSLPQHHYARLPVPGGVAGRAPCLCDWPGCQLGPGLPCAFTIWPFLVNAYLVMQNGCPRPREAAGAALSPGGPGGQGLSGNWGLHPHSGAEGHTPKSST